MRQTDYENTKQAMLLALTHICESRVAYTEALRIFEEAEQRYIRDYDTKEWQRHSILKLLELTMERI